MMVRVMPLVFRIRERLDLAIRHGFRIVRWTPRDASARETIMG
jgi:hypothetical protein